MKTIIGLAGLKGHGKTTIAHELVITTNGSTMISFADPLRAFATACGFDMNRKEDLDGTLGNWSPRAFMPLAGTEFGRNILGEDFWIQSLESRLDQSRAHTVIIHDVRFKNERDWIRSKGGQIVWIHRPGVTKAYDKHVSENAMASSDCDFDVINDQAPLAAVYALMNRIGQ